MLRAVIGIKNSGNCAGIIEEPEKISAFREAEVGVETCSVGNISAGSMNHEKAAGAYRNVRKCPFLGVVRIVGERPSQKVHWLVGIVIELDPVRIVLEFVGKD